MVFFRVEIIALRFTLSLLKMWRLGLFIQLPCLIFKVRIINTLEMKNLTIPNKHVIGCIFLLIMNLVAQVSAFWSSGHMIVARIAYEQIKSINPTLMEQIEAEIGHLGQFSKDGNYPFVEASNWPDDIKELGMSQFSQWHVVRTPIIRDGYQGDTFEEPQNATWAINQIIQTLNFTEKKSIDAGFGVSFAWRFLIHLVGDIHQPLHTGTLYTKEFPESDNIGHRWKIDYAKPEMDELHHFWDA